MAGFLLLGLLGIGALAGLFNMDSDESRGPPSSPGNAGDDEITIDSDGGTVNAGRGDDLVTGSWGMDLISGETGDDTLDGQAGNDVAFGGTGDDTLRGNDDDDLLSGGAGDDLVHGGEGDDFLSGDLGEDSLNGGLNDDILIGTATKLGDLTAEEFSTIMGGSSGSILNSYYLPDPGADDTDAGDELNGAYGNDLLVLGNDDTGIGGPGDDVFTLGNWITEGNPALISDFNAEDDRILLSFTRSDGVPEDLAVTSNAAGDALISLGGVQIATVTAAGDALTVEDITVISRSSDAADGAIIRGTNAADTFTLGDTDDEITLRNGADTATLGAGDDLARGGAGGDTISGGLGDDTVFGGQNADLLDLGDGADRANGDEGNDTLLGGAGDDLLRGGADHDLLIDGSGADSLLAGTGADTIVGSQFGGEPTEAPFELSGLDLSADQDAVGDVLIGGYGEDVIYFGHDDTVSGGENADRLIGTDAATGALITDFDIAEDTLVISVANSGIALNVSYSAGATATTGDAIISYAGAQIATLQGVGTNFTAANIALNPRGTGTI